MASFFPQIGAWFKDTDTDQRFEIVAIDEKQHTIELQYIDGDISEYDIESWGALNIQETEAPEEVYAGFENISAYGDEVPLDSTFIQGNPLESIEPETFNGFDDLF